MFYIYIIYSLKINRYYIGHSQKPWRRVVQHRESKAEKYTAPTDDWNLRAVFEVSEIEAEAIKLERYIKKQKSRRLIEKLCNLDFKPDGKLAQLSRVPHVRN